MTPQQALNLLYQAARHAPLNAESHEQVKQAVQVLLKHLPEDKREEEPKEKKK